MLVKILEEVEAEWRTVLGDEAYVELQRALTVLNDHLETMPVGSSLD